MEETENKPKNTNNPPKNNNANDLWLVWQRMFPFSKVLFFVALLQGVLVIAVGIVTIVIPRKDCFDSQGRAIICSDFFRVNQSIALFAWALFFLVEVFDGLFYGNLYELYAAMFQSCFVTAWAIWRFLEPYANNYLDYMFLIVCSACQLLYIGIGPILYKEYAWVLYRKAGADVKDQAIYRKFLLWLSLLKLDTVFGIFCTLLSGRGVFNTGWSAALDWTMFGLCILFLLIGWMVVKNEHSKGTIAWFFLFPLLPAYVIGFWLNQYKFNNYHPAADYTSKTLGTLFTVCGAVSLVARLLLVFLSAAVFKNFGQGVKAIESNTNNKRDDKERPRTSTLGDGDTEIDEIYVNFPDRNCNLSPAESADWQVGLNIPNEVGYASQKHSHADTNSSASLTNSKNESGSISNNANSHSSASVLNSPPDSVMKGAGSKRSTQLL